MLLVKLLDGLIICVGCVVLVVCSVFYLFCELCVDVCDEVCGFVGCCLCEYDDFCVILFE